MRRMPHHRLHVGSFGTEPSGFEDFGRDQPADRQHDGNNARRLVYPDGLADWGDGRLFLVGTEGTLELRKNLDLLGRSGGDHMFVSNTQQTRYQDCSALPVTYYRDFLDDVRNRLPG